MRRAAARLKPRLQVVGWASLPLRRGAFAARLKPRLQVGGCAPPAL